MNAARFLPLPRHGADGRTLAFIGLALLVAAGNWTGIFRNALSVPLGYPLAFIGCIAAHNHMHLPVFRNWFWNSIHQLALAFAIGQPPTGIITAHNERHHKHADSGSEYDHSRNLTGKTANFFLLNNGYHTAHHLRPAMHWSKLPEYHEREIAPRMNPALNHRSLIGLLAERVRRPRFPHAKQDTKSHFT